MKNNILVGTLVVLMAIVTIPSAIAANTFYLDQQDSTGTIGGSTYVDLKLYVDTLPTGNFGSYQVTIEFDDSTVNIPDSEVTLLWGSIKNAGTTGNKISITGLDMTGSGVGTYTLATMRLDGQSTGVSALNFVEIIELSDLTPSPITYTVINGTYTIPAAIEPDLIVTKIDPSKTIFVNATNIFTLYVKNQGTANVPGSFDVSWNITDDASTILASGTETITGLNIGEEKSFDFNWKPTVLQNTSLTVTADSGSAVTESDETNNDLSVSYVQDDESSTGILPLSKWGYGGDETLTTYTSGEVLGDLIYTFGDSVYLGGYNNVWSTYTVNFTLGTDVNKISGIAEGIGSGTVKEARLYMYYNWYRYPDAGRPADPEEKMTMTFNGSPVSTDAKYEDAKGFSTYSGYKYGTFVYNVTSNVTGDGTYQAVLSNAGEGDTHGTSIYSMALLVIYEDSSKTLKQYHIAEGHDLLKQYYLTGDRYQYRVIPEDATSTFNLPAVTGDVISLFTVSAAAADGDDKSRLYFNAGNWNSPWPYISGIKMGTDTKDVT
ncbi:MAG: DUF3344 domain-containing protein, partial [Methanosarcinales archaeon]|nr:DUF3344 domain-containing protein [Methanosarcinales archaeon]